MGAHDRGHVSRLERLELKSADAIASRDCHRVSSRLPSHEARFAIRRGDMPYGEPSTGTPRAVISPLPTYRLAPLGGGRPVIGSPERWSQSYQGHGHLLQSELKSRLLE
jgi:hypothetical protein